MQSELSPSTLALIKDVRWTQDDYSKAVTEFSKAGRGLPSNTQVTQVARMYAACRLYPQVRTEIGDNIDEFVGWVIPEMYIQLGQA